MLLIASRRPVLRAYRVSVQAVNSEVREVDGMAVKLSTETTGRSAWLSGTSAPENLLDQFRFMDTLATYFGDNAEVTAPDQYLALRSRSGAYLSVQQYMDGWQSLQSWIDGDQYLWTIQSR